MLYRGFLLVSLIAVAVLAYVFIPGPEYSSNISLHIGTGEVYFLGSKFTTNILLSIFSTVESLLVACCCNLLLNHLAQLWLHRNSKGVSPATLDAMFNKAQPFQIVNQIMVDPDSKAWTVAVITVLALVINPVTSAVLQSFLQNNSTMYPFDSAFLFTNTSFLDPSLVRFVNQDMGYGFLGLSPASFKALSLAASDVSGACNSTTAVCGTTAINSTATWSKCTHDNELDCRAFDMTIFSDYSMDCISGILKDGGNPENILFTGKSILSEVAYPPYILVNNSASGGVNFTLTPPVVQWNVVERVSGRTPVFINCTIQAAQATRTESSLNGTWAKYIDHIYDGKGSDLFLYSADFTTCFGVPTPYCILAMVGISLKSMVQTEAMPIGTSDSSDASGFSFLTTIMDPTLSAISSTTSTINDAVVYLYTQEMRFTVERMYKRLLALNLQSTPESSTTVTCTYCIIKKTWWAQNKLGFLIALGAESGIAAAMVVVSIIFSFKWKDVKSVEGFRTVNVLALPVDRSQFVGDSKAEYKKKLVVDEAGYERWKRESSDVISDRNFDMQRAGSAEPLYQRVGTSENE
ncbi:UNVERIFIED_CONTAM: hypothetical protein HDU68_008664 [Siphonaria sp. JEL0065]|nr:hypothetical protein HDU68_008664 [Siphonaria sp. JEL0065]